MKTKSILLLTLFAALSVCCNSDSDDDNQNNTYLTQKIIYAPQSTNYTNKLVTNYVNNRVIGEISYNGSDEVTQTKEYTYGTNTYTVSTYDPQHVFLRKMVYNFDATNRISTVALYNDQNQLYGTREYVYQGNDINVNYIENGDSSPLFLYKTNSNNLIYYEKSIFTGVEQTLTYIGDMPTQLMASSGLQLGFEFFPNVMPLAIQTDAIKINNSALLSLSIQQIKEASNYYLKKINIPGGYTKYDKEFNAENYIIHELRASGVNNPSGEQVTGELFYYYN